MTSMYRPALRWMNPYSHASRDMGEASKLASASSSESEGGARCAPRPRRRTERAPRARRARPRPPRPPTPRARDRRPPRRRARGARARRRAGSARGETRAREETRARDAPRRRPRERAPSEEERPRGGPPPEPPKPWEVCARAEAMTTVQEGASGTAGAAASADDVRHFWSMPRPDE